MIRAKKNSKLFHQICPRSNPLTYLVLQSVFNMTHPGCSGENVEAPAAPLLPLFLLVFLLSLDPELLILFFKRLSHQRGSIRDRLRNFLHHLVYLSPFFGAHLEPQVKFVVLHEALGFLS